MVNPETTVDVQRAFAKLDPLRLRRMTSEELFPSRPRSGRCRICARRTELTREHIPPRTAFNTRQGTSPTLLEWYSNPGLELPDTGSVFQGGVWGYILCDRCNNTTGRYGREYGDWARGAARVLTSLERSLEELDHLDQWGYANVHFRGVYPGRFVRQAISMVLSVSGSFELSARHPELRELALGGRPMPLPADLRLFLGLYAGPMVRFVGGPWGQPTWSDQADGWSWVIEAAFPPFSIQLLVDGDPSRLGGVDISGFTKIDTAAKSDFQIEKWMIGFGHIPHPTDFRTIGMLASRG